MVEIVLHMFLLTVFRFTIVTSNGNIGNVQVIQDATWAIYCYKNLDHPEETLNAKYRFLTLCSYHVTYVFQSESTLYMYVKELLSQSRCEI